MDRNPNLNVSSSNNFQLTFGKLPSDNEITKNFVLHVYETVIPGVSFTESIESWQGFDIKYITSNLNYNNWTVNFDVNEHFENWLKILEWMQMINNNINVAGNSLDQYAIDASLSIYDNWGTHIINFIFHSMFPINLGDINMSFRDADANLYSTATFVYNYYSIDKK